MRKKMMGFVFAAALMVAMAVPLFSGGGSAFATADLGVDGAANCFGKNVAASAVEHKGNKKAIEAHNTPSIKAHVRAINDSYCPGSPGGPR